MSNNKDTVCEGGLTGPKRAYNSLHEYNFDIYNTATPQIVFSLSDALEACILIFIQAMLVIWKQRFSDPWES